MCLLLKGELDEASLMQTVGGRSALLTVTPSALSHSPSSSREGHPGPEHQGPKRKLYSAVPGRHFVVVKSYQPQAEGEIPLYKNDRVKGEAQHLWMCTWVCMEFGPPACCSNCTC